jgi:hypothetical protein
MAAKLTRLVHKIAIQLHLMAESCTICSSRSRRPVRKLLDTPSSSTHGETDEYGILIGKPLGKQTLGRLRQRGVCVRCEIAVVKLWALLLRCWLVML